MKRLLTVFSLCFLLLFTVGRLTVYAQDDPEDNSSAFFNIVPKIATDSVTSDLFTGTMRYAIPILVPAGRKGMEPKLSLTYRSSQQNGWLGLGWELEVGAVERSTKNGVDFNGYSYILRINGAAIELINVNGEYRAKIESGFLRIRAYKDSSGQPTSWEVTDKSGVRYLYGQTSDSRQDDAGDLTRNISPDPNKVFKWCLDHVQDANGNYMQFSYFKDQGQIYLDHIDYTGNGILTPRNKITFVRDDGTRPDAPVMYTTNFMVRTTYRLASIDVYGNGNLMRSYKINYTTSGNTLQSLVSSIQQFGKDNVSTLPALRLDYSTESTSFSAATWSALRQLWGGSGYLNKFADFNGDGRSDALMIENGYETMYCTPHACFYNGAAYVALSNGSSFNEATPWGTLGNTHLPYILADFDGDGKTDVLSFRDTEGGYRNYHDGNLYVALSTGADFGTPTSWLGRNEADTIPFGVADFDGDGKTDIVYVGADGSLQVFLSTGSPTTGFTSLPSSTIMANGDKTRYRFADFDGDGKTDALFIDSDGGLHVALSTGSGFTAASSWVTMSGLDQTRYNVADFDGDGKADLVYVGTDGSLLVALSTGSSFITAATPWGTIGTGDSTRYRFADFDGDGKTDALFIGSDGGLHVALSTDSGFTAASPWVTMGNGTLWRYRLGDFSGDGKVDVLYMNVQYAYQDPVIPQVATVPGQSDNLLVKISNGFGGSTIIAYAPSTSYTQTQLPIPVQTVRSIKIDDGNGNVSETIYGYEGGYYHIDERDFRGFNHVTITGPVGPNGEQKVTETWFHQGNDIAVDANDPFVSTGYLKGKPYRTRIEDGSRNIYSETTTSYASNTNANGGYFYSPDTATTFICDGVTTTCNSATSGQNKMTKYSYDGYGNVTMEQVYDSANATAPYRTTKRTFSSDNTANYLVGLPKDENIYDGAGTEASSTKYYYDDASDCSSLSRSKSQSPTKGNVTTIVYLLKEKAPGSADPEVNMSYDDFGNLTCSRDPKGFAVGIFYDNVTNTYITKTKNAKEHLTETKYYGVDGVALDTGLYGQLKSITNPNLAETKIAYDALGRKTRVMDPYGANAQYGTESYFYNDSDLGTANQRVTTYTTTDYATSAVTWKEVYFDGLGRTIKTRQTGPDNKVIKTTKAYDARGAASQSSIPFFEGSAGPVQTFKYDAVGRVREITNPDGTKAKACYLYGVTGGVDAEGHRKRETRDVFGRLVRVDEYDKAASDCTADGGTPYAVTQYQYDVLGNLRFVTDAENNQTEMRYDSLGRKIFMHDPDMSGSDGKDWTYSYDANGNLEYQADAKSQTIHFVYDELNRVVLKDYPTGTDVTYTYDDAPDGTAPTYPIGRLSKMADVSGTTKLYYDKLGTPTTTIKTVDNTSYNFASTYDALGRPTSITYPDSDTVTYAYNTAGLLSLVSGAGVNYATYENYNALGQPGALTYGNGITTTYQYYPTNYRLQSIVTGNADQTLINLAYTYYDAGSVKDIVNYTDSARSQSFWYDGLDRLQQVQIGNVAQFYDYTPIGNMKLKEGITYDYTGPKPHAVKTTSNGKSYSYDDNGNMTSESLGSVAYRSIIYDYDNMPQSITINNTSTTSFVYDGAGARVKKVSPSGGSIYLGKLYECNGQSCTTYIFAEGRRIALKSGSEVYYYHQDHLGSTLVVTDSRAAQEYPCSGQPVRITGTTPQSFSTIQAAYNAASDGAVIQTRAGIFSENLDLSRNIAVTLSGGYDCGYTSRMENSELVGMLSDNAGRVTIENFEIVITGYAKRKVEDVQYLPFGESGSDVGYLSVNHKYTSQELDAETGLYYYGARYYNPVLARFISPDTIVPDYANPQSLNRFSYVVNNPLYYTDPTGHDLYFPDELSGYQINSGDYLQLSIPWTDGSTTTLYTNNPNYDLQSIFIPAGDDIMSGNLMTLEDVSYQKDPLPAFDRPTSTENARITDDVGPREKHPVTGKSTMHKGTDISGPGFEGSDIKAVAGGKVIRTGYQGNGAGNYLVVDIGGIEGKPQEVKYMHLDKIYFSRDYYIMRGDILGTGGDTGITTAPCLHIEYWNENSQYLLINNWFLDAYPKR